MRMPDELKRIQVSMSRPLRDALRDWAAELSKERDEEFGTGSVAALLLEEILKRPALVHDLLMRQSVDNVARSKEIDPGKKSAAGNKKAA